MQIQTEEALACSPQLHGVDGLQLEADRVRVCGEGRGGLLPVRITR